MQEVQETRVKIIDLMAKNLSKVYSAELEGVDALIIVQRARGQIRHTQSQPARDCEQQRA